MRVRVRLFGPAARAQGASEVSIRLDRRGEHAHAGLLEAIGAQHESLAAFARQGRLAVDGRYAPERVHVDEASELALISMVSGG